MRGGLADFRGAVWCGLRTGPVGPRQAEPRSLASASKVSFLPHLPQLFNDAIRLAVSYKQNSRDFMDEVLQELEVGQAQCQVGPRKWLPVGGSRTQAAPEDSTYGVCPAAGGVTAGGKVRGQASPTAMSTEL